MQISDQGLEINVITFFKSEELFDLSNFCE